MSLSLVSAVGVAVSITAPVSQLSEPLSTGLHGEMISALLSLQCENIDMRI